MFLPSKTASFISLTLGMASLPEVDFEIPERVDLQRPARMHDDRGVGRLDYRRTLDAVARFEQRPVVDRGHRRLLQLGPVNVAPAPAGFRIDLRVELFRR